MIEIECRDHLFWQWIEKVITNRQIRVFLARKTNGALFFEQRSNGAYFRNRPVSIANDQRLTLADPCQVSRKMCLDFVDVQTDHDPILDPIYGHVYDLKQCSKWGQVQFPAEISNKGQPKSNLAHFPTVSIFAIHIYRGVIPVIVIQLMMLALLAIFPGLVTYLPGWIYS